MNYRYLHVLIVLCTGLLFNGCVGYNPPHFLQMKPYTLLKGGDQLGRDQLANRWLVAQKLVPMKDKDSREVITLLGQPQQVEVVQHQVSEDWYFIYYKNYKTKPLTDEGSFLVRFYNDKVIDVIKLN